MLNAVIRLDDIRYEETLSRIFPALSGHISKMKSDHMLIRLFQKMGNSALPVLTGVMSRLERETKDEILARGLNACAPELKDSLNEALQEDGWGKCFRIGDLSAVNVKEYGIILNVEQIEVNYADLLKNEKVNDALDSSLGMFSSIAKSVTALASLASPEMLEKAGIELLSLDSSKKKLLDLLKNALRENGIRTDVGEFQLIQSVKETGHTKGTPFTVTSEMENDFIQALAGYLKDTAEKQPH